MTHGNKTSEDFFVGGFIQSPISGLDTLTANARYSTTANSLILSSYAVSKYLSIS